MSILSLEYWNILPCDGLTRTEIEWHNAGCIGVNVSNVSDYEHEQVIRAMRGRAVSIHAIFSKELYQNFAIDQLMDLIIWGSPTIITELLQIINALPKRTIDIFLKEDPSDHLHLLDNYLLARCVSINHKWIVSCTDSENIIEFRLLTD